MEQQRFDNQIYNAAVYCRLSSEDGQAGDSNSIQTQKAILERYCRDNGFLIHDFYVDDGYSGLNFNRPSFERMLTDIDNRIVNMVVTKDLSRLGRDYIQTGYYTEIYFNKKKVRYIAVNDGYDSVRDDNDIAPFKHILNDMYAKDLSRKVKSAKRQRMINGCYSSSQAPYGYKPNPSNHNQLVVDNEAAEVVKTIFDMALHGLGARRITAELKARKVINPSAYKAKNGDTRFSRYNQGQDPDHVYDWCWATIQSILRNRVYTGDIVNHKYEVVNYKTKERINIPKDKQIIVENTHEAIVSHDDFKRVQGLMDMRFTPHHIEHENLFRSMLFCSGCNHSLTMAHKSRAQGSKAYYRCMYHYKTPDECKHTHAIAYDDLYTAVLNKIRQTAKRLKSDVGFLEAVGKKSGKNNQTTRLSEQKSKHEKRLNELFNLLRKLFEKNAAGLLDDANYVAFSREYQAEQADIMRKLADVKAELAETGKTTVNAEKLRELILEYLEIKELTPFILAKLIDRILVGHKQKVDGEEQQEITIVWRFAGEL